ncbi:MAG: alpha/beta hydrolase [Phycisphaerales bacterium]|nr:alpha/beta hydrolase [Phycisphaerales bacterium]
MPPRATLNNAAADQPSTQSAASVAPRRRVWRRRRRVVRASLLVMLVGVGVSITSCMPSIRATPEQIALLKRHEVAATGAPGRAISYLSAGEPSAPRVIFIHGSPGSAKDYADYLVWPPSGVEVVAVDRLGFGKSVTSNADDGRARRDAVLSLAEQAESIRPLLVARNGHRPILVGHSLGGPIAAKVAADFPDDVAGLIILAGSLDPAHEAPRWYNEVLSWRLISWATPGVIDNSNAEMMVTREEATSLTTSLAKIRCPVVVIHGQDDPLVSIDNVRYIETHMINAASMTTIRISNEGHFLPWNRESEVRQQLQKLMERAWGALERTPETNAVR